MSCNDSFAGYLLFEIMMRVLNNKNRKNEKVSKHRLCACNFRQVGQESRFIIFIDDMFGKE